VGKPHFDVRRVQKNRHFLLNVKRPNPQKERTVLIDRRNQKRLLNKYCQERGLVRENVMKNQNQGIKK
jgi:hypothetical protein